MRDGRRLLVTVVLVMVCALAFAGGQGESASGVDDGSQEEGGGTVTFTAWHLLDETWGPFYEADFAAFEEANPQYDIIPLVVTYESYFDKMVTLIAAGSPPDIVANLAPYLAIFIDGDQLTPINNYIDVETLDNEYFPTDVNRRDDDIYGLPFGGRTMQLLYNRRMLEEAGVSVPTNREELVEAAIKLTDSENDVYGYAIQTNVANFDDTYESLVTHTMSFGGNFADDGEPTATDPNTIAGVEFFKSLVDLGVTPVNVQKSTIRELFFAEKVAMMIDGPWIPGQFDERNPEKAGRIGMADNPFENKVAPGGVYYFFVIPKRAANKAGAGAYLNWTMRPEWHRNLTQQTGLPAGRKDSITPELLEEKPFMEAELRGMNQYAFQMEPEGFEDISITYMKTVIDYLGEALYGDEPVKSAMESLQEELEGLRE